MYTYKRTSLKIRLISKLMFIKKYLVYIAYLFIDEKQKQKTNGMCGLHNVEVFNVCCSVIYY